MTIVIEYTYIVMTRSYCLCAIILIIIIISETFQHIIFQTGAKGTRHARSMSPSYTTETNPAGQ